MKMIKDSPRKSSYYDKSKRRNKAIEYIEEHYPETAKEFQEIQYEQYETYETSIHHTFNTYSFFSCDCR